LSRLFPKQFDNDYRGYWVAVVLFVVVVALRVVQAVDVIVITEMVMKGADGIRIERFDPEAAQTAKALFSLLGVQGFILPILCFIALLRYRSMIPLMFVILLLQSLAGRIMITLRPVSMTPNEAEVFMGISIGLAFSLAVWAMTILGLVLSLKDRSHRGVKLA
jgi:hypothetical protein